MQQNIHIYIYINLEFLEVAKIIDKCIFLKFIITKSNK